MSETRRLVVCITGASGSTYPRRLLHLLAAARDGTLPGVDARPDLSVDLIASDNAAKIWQQELDEPMPKDLGHTAFRRWDRTDFSAPFASGSSAPDAVIVVPCSMSWLVKTSGFRRSIFERTEASRLRSLQGSSTPPGPWWPCSTRICKPTQRTFPR